MGLGQLGAMIPGLGPVLDPSQQSKVNETVLLKSSSSTEQTKTIHETMSHQNTITAVSSISSKSDDTSNPSTYLSAHPVIQTVSASDKQPSSSLSLTSSHSSSTNATVTVSSSTASVVSTPSIGGVIMNPYHHQYYIAAAHAAQAAASTTPVVSSVATVASSATTTASPVTVAASSATPATSQAKEKAITYTVNTSKSPVTATTISSSTTAVVTQPSATAATPTVMPTQMQYVVGGGNQQQLYAMPGSAHIQTGFLFFQQPNGVMVAIPAQTVIQPGGSSQVAVTPQVATIANGAVAVQQQQQQQKQKTPDASATGEKSRAKSESEATNETASKQQKQLYLPVMQQQQQQQQPHELKLTSAKGKRSSSSTVSEDSTHKSSKEQAQSVRHHSASSATASHTKYQQLYIPRGAHAYRVAAAQATAQEQAKNQQSTGVVTTSTTTSVTTSSVTTLEKAKEGDEASASGSVVPIQVVHQQQYARGDRHAVAQQSHKQMIVSSAGGSSLRMAAIYAGGRPSVLFTTAGTPSSTSQTMLHAVQQGPSGVYEVKASTIADIDPVFVKTLTEKYEHEIVKVDYQTAILNKSQSTENNENISTSASNEAGNKVTKTVSFASHKDQSRLSANQTPSSFDETIAAIDRTLASQQTISDDVATVVTKQTKTGDNRKRAQTKKTPQADQKESAKPVASPSNEPSVKPPQVTGARKRKGAKADLESSQDTAQPPKRKRTPAKKKAAQAEDTEDENKPAKTTPTQRGGRKGRAANESGKGGLKTAVVSISLDMLVDVPSPSEPDEVSEI